MSQLFAPFQPLKNLTKWPIPRGMYKSKFSSVHADSCTPLPFVCPYRQHLAARIPRMLLVKLLMTVAMAVMMADSD